MTNIETPLKSKIRPLTIRISETEILADLRYPVTVPVAPAPAGKRP